MSAMDPELPARTKLLRGNVWPFDRHRDEIDVGDYLLFVSWEGYPTASVGQVIKIGKTGKVTVRKIKLHPKDVVSDIEIKECRTTTKLSKATVGSLAMDKLARE